MPAIEVAPNAGKLLRMLVQMSGARRVLEIGTLAGFSSMWMAQGLPDDGRIVTCEFLQKHADVARANLDAAGVGHKVDIRVGAALDTLPTLAGQESFDFVFIDADKENDANYLDWAIRLGHPGTVIVVDNVIWDGAILAPGRDEVNAPGIVAMLERMGQDPRLDATAIQTVGSKGWDGFAIASGVLRETGSGVARPDRTVPGLHRCRPHPDAGPRSRWPTGWPRRSWSRTGRGRSLRTGALHALHLGTHPWPGCWAGVGGGADRRWTGVLVGAGRQSPGPGFLSSQRFCAGRQTSALRPILVLVARTPDGAPRSRDLAESQRSRAVPTADSCRYGDHGRCR